MTVKELIAELESHPLILDKEVVCVDSIANVLEITSISIEEHGVVLAIEDQISEEQEEKDNDDIWNLDEE